MGQKVQLIAFNINLNYNTFYSILNNMQLYVLINYIQ